jgi:chromosomal replication initiation ATPase DnaA
VNIWDQILALLRETMPHEDFRRWFGATSYASDSGDQISVWVPSESIRRHIDSHHQDEIDRALRTLGRPGSYVRLRVGGLGDEDEEP